MKAGAPGRSPPKKPRLLDALVRLAGNPDRLSGGIGELTRG